MITGDIKNKVDQIWNTFWSGGVSNPLSVIEQMDQIFGQAMFRTLRLFDFDQRQIEKLLDWSCHNSYTKTNSRSVLGSMNDMTFHVKHHIACEGGLSSVDMDSLHLRINQIPFSAIGFDYPWQKLKALL